MSRDDRLRVVLVGLLAVGVMGGVIASALAARKAGPAGGDGRDVVHLPPPTSEAPRPRRGREEEMPAGCEVDPAAPPALAFDVEGGVLDLGRLRQNATVDREVVVRNRGKGVLCIQQVEAGCGCMKATWPGSKLVPPGGSGTLKIHADTSGREGTVSKTISVYTNEPPRKVSQLTVRLDVVLGIVVPSSTLSFGQRGPGRPATARVRMKSPRDEPEWQVTAVESMEPKERATAFTWTVEPVEPNDPKFRHVDLVVTHPGRAQTGSSPERVRVRTTHPDRKEVVLDSQLYVQARFWTGPARASFGFVRPTDPTPHKTIHVNPGEPGTRFVVTGATVEGPGFVAKPPRQTNEGWAVDVRYDGQPRKIGKVSATLVVSIDDAELPVLRVPLEATVAAESPSGGTGK